MSDLEGKQDESGNVIIGGQEVSAEDYQLCQRIADKAGCPLHAALVAVQMIRDRAATR